MKECFKDVLQKSKHYINITLYRWNYQIGIATMCVQK